MLPVGKWAASALLSVGGLALAVCSLAEGPTDGPVGARGTEGGHSPLSVELFGEGRLEYDLKALEAGGEGTVTMAAEVRPTGSSDLDDGRLVLLSVTPDGSKISRAVSLLEPEADLLGSSHGGRFTGVYGLAAGEGNRLLCLLQLDAADFSMLEIEGDRQRSFRLIKTGAEVIVNSWTPLSDGGFLAAGHREFDSLALRTDRDGNVVWRMKQDLGETDFYLDTLAVANGGSILVGNSGEYDFLHKGPSKVLLKSLDARGNVLAETELPGRYGSLAAVDGGGIVLAYDRKTTESQDIVVQAFNKNLAPLWQTEIVKAGLGFSRFRIASLPDGGFVVTGARDDHPYVVVLDSNGGRRWDFWGRELRSGDDAFPAVGVKEVFVGSTVFAEQEDRILRQRIQILRFAY